MSEGGLCWSEGEVADVWCEGGLGWCEGEVGDV